MMVSRSSPLSPCLCLSSAIPHLASSAGAVSVDMGPFRPGAGSTMMFITFSLTSPLTGRPISSGNWGARYTTYEVGARNALGGTRT